MALTRPKYSQIYDTDWKQSVELATTADVGNLVLANVQPNSIDGITVQTNYRILVKDQTSGAQNGIYLVRDAGTGSNGWWTRSLDALTSDRVTAGLTVSVISGSVNGGKEFKLTTPDPITLGVTPLTFIDPFAAAGAGGANTQIQFNDASILNGSAGLTFNKYSNVLTVGGYINTTGNLSAASGVIGSVSLNSGLIHRLGGETLVIGGGQQLTRPLLRLSNGSNGGFILYGGSTATTAPTTTANTSVLDAGDGNLRIRSTYQTTVVGNINVTGNILPSANVTYDLGSPTQKWRSAYFSGNTVYIGSESMSVSADGTWTFTSNGANASIGSTSATGNIYMDKTTGFMGFNDTSPDFVYDFLAPADGGELLHIETGVGTQAWFGAQNFGGLRYAAGVDQDYVFSGSHDRPDHYVLMTAGMVRANIHGHTGNVIFSNSISVTQDVSTKYLGTQEFRATSSNITVRSDVTLLGTKLYGAGQLAIGTEDIGAEKLFVTGGESYLDGDVTITGNLFVNGNVTTFNANNLSIQDSLIYLADDNPADTIDIGFVSAFTDAVRYQHTGFVRDASDGRWKLFANVVAEPTTTVDFTDAIYSTIQVGNIYAGGTVGAAGTYLSQTGSGLAWATLSAQKIFNTGSNVTVDTSYVNVAVNGSNVASFGTTNLIVGNILPTANNVSNIGSSTSKFNTVHARATQAQYADLAEVYTSDQQYPAGTVVVFGGSAEVTQSRDSHDTRIAGVVSTDPAYLMNSTATGVPVALQGRVPCRVMGPIEQGDRVVSSHIPGVAQRLDLQQYQPGCIIGKALQSVNSADISIIEVVVGRV